MARHMQKRLAMNTNRHPSRQDRPYRRCSAERLATLRAAAVKAGDVNAVRLIDAEMPLALADAADDSAPLGYGSVFAM